MSNSNEEQFKIQPYPTVSACSWLWPGPSLTEAQVPPQQEGDLTKVNPGA
jgi:hypothetical protein